MTGRPRLPLEQLLVRCSLSRCLLCAGDSERKDERDPNRQSNPAHPVTICTALGTLPRPESNRASSTFRPNASESPPGREALSAGLSRLSPRTSPRRLFWPGLVRSLLVGALHVRQGWASRSRRRLWEKRFPRPVCAFMKIKPSTPQRAGCLRGKHEVRSSAGIPARHQNAEGVSTRT